MHLKYIKYSKELQIVTGIIWRPIWYIASYNRLEAAGS